MITANVFRLPVLSAVLSDRDAVRPKRAGTTMQKYNYFFNLQWAKAVFFLLAFLLILLQSLSQALFMLLHQRLGGEDGDVGLIRKQEAFQLGVDFDIDADV